jgi:hypothetical protein
MEDRWVSRNGSKRYIRVGLLYLRLPLYRARYENTDEKVSDGAQISYEPTQWTTVS